MRELSIEYNKRKRLLLWRIRQILPYGHWDEDVLHDAIVKALEGYDLVNQPVGRLLGFLAKKTAIDLRKQQRRVDIGLPLSLNDGADLVASIDARLAALRATRVLTSDEVGILLEDWDRQPPAEYAKRIRIAKRKAREAMLDA